MKWHPFLWLLAGDLILHIVAAESSEPWTLERAVTHALTNSPDARLAQHRISAAQAGLQQANAAFWPQVQIQSSYTRTDNPIGVFGAALNQRAFRPALDFNHVPDADDVNVKGIVTVPLYNGGRNAAGRDAAKANAEAARLEAEAIRNVLAFEVARAFFTVLKTREFIRATEAAVRSFEASLSSAQQRLDAGTALKADVLDVEVRLAQAREDLVHARNALALAERALGNLLGLEPGGFSVSDSVPELAVAVGGGSSVRPELRAARHRTEAVEAELRRARGGYLPRVHAFNSLDYDYGWKFDGDGKSYTAGVMAQWDLWDGRQTRAKVNAARAQLNGSREEERKLRLAIDFELQQARLNLHDAGERLAVTEKSVAQAAESAELTRHRFAQGLALTTQLIDSQTALTAARVRRAEAEADRRIAIAALRKALGLPQLSSTAK